MTSKGNKKKSKSTEEQAQEVWDKADDVLKHVDQAYIFSVAKKECRLFPTFSVEEIQSGPLLGKGGFSNVHEIINMKVKKEEAEESAKDKEEEEEEEQQARPPLSSNSKNTNKLNDSSTHDDYEIHYELSEAKTIMSQRCMRFGSARYAIKRLRPDLSNELEFARGALDLAIEIKYMSVLWHPNIVKMRAISKTPRLSLDTFIVMDRLYGTLDDRLNSWIETNNMMKGCCGTIKDTQQSKDLLKERMLVAYDLTKAIEYMHSNRLLYRDIKPENIGFDIRGDVKVFDFGLMKSLDDKYKAKGKYGYNLTAFTGSVPYMAPEIALKEPYDKEVDVFSMSMLLWEIVSLEILYPDYSIKDYFIRVCKNNERPPIHGKWPPIVKALVQEGWDRDPQKRPNMKRVGMLLRGLLQDMSNKGEDSIVNRTEHMMNKSRRSLHNITDAEMKRAGLSSSRTGNHGGQRTSRTSNSNASAASSTGHSTQRRENETVHKYDISNEMENGAE